MAATPKRTDERRKHIEMVGPEDGPDHAGPVAPLRVGPEDGPDPPTTTPPPTPCAPDRHESGGDW